MGEVQAAVGEVLLRFKAAFSGLPLILYHGFKKVPDAKRMLELFPTLPDQDHNPAFEAVGLCATSSLLADDAEAPAKSVFLMGYSVGNLTGVLEKLLECLGIPKGKVKDVAKAVLAAAKYGLDTRGIPGGKSCKSGRSGHMLQLFLRRELVDKYVYASLPMGVPDAPRNLPLSKYMEKNVQIQGQVRITFHPNIFLQARYARLFSNAADPTYHNNRGDFMKALVGLLDPILKDTSVRIKAARGIFGGDPPDWWSAEAQDDAAKEIGPKRFRCADAIV